MTRIHDRVLIAAIAAGLALAGSSAGLADTFNWVGTTSGNWSDGSNWGGTAPDGTDDTDVLVFNPNLSSTVTVNADNNFDGDFLLNTLTLSRNTDSGSNHLVTVNLNPTGVDAALAFAAGGTVNLLANNATNNRVINYNVAIPIKLSGGLTFTGNGTGGFNFTGGISGTGPLTKTGSSVLAIGAASTYTGETIVSGGVLRAVDGVGLPTNSLLTLSGGAFESSANFTRSLGSGNGQVRLTAAASGFSAHGSDIVVALGGIATPTALTWGSGNFAPASNLLLNAASATHAIEFVNSVNLGSSNRTITVNASTATMSGTISGTGQLLKRGTGTLVLTGDNTYSNRTDVTGTLVFSTIGNVGGGASNLGNPSSASNGIIQLGSFTNMGTLLYTGSGHTTDRAINNNGQSAGGNTINASGTGALVFTSNVLNTQGTTGGGAKNLTLRGTNTGNNEIQGLINDLNNNPTGDSQRTNIVKADAGKWILSGNNTYTGTTIVNAGTLLINGTHNLHPDNVNTTAVGAYTVNNTAVLGGTGHIHAGLTVNANAFLAPGNSIGTFTVTGDVLLNGTLLIELGGGTSDRLTVHGLLDITNAKVDFDVLAALTSPVYVFASYTSLTGTFSESNITNLPEGYEIDYAYQGNQFALIIPEPGTLALLAIGTLLIVRRRASC
jgi:autotransporter-associated beta strand protein